MTSRTKERARLRAKEAQQARTRTVREKNQARNPATAVAIEQRRNEAIEQARRAPVHPAATQACSSCPWRSENKRGETDPWLSDGHLMGYWDQIRSGSAMVCHKTCVLPEVLTERAATHGWAPTPEHAQKRECAGALAQMLKEEELLLELGSYEAYFAKRGPFGVTPHGFEVLFSRRAGEVAPAVRGLAGLDQYEHPWFPAPAGEATMPIVPPCACPVCAHHEDAHLAVTLISPGSDDQVRVDAPLAPLVEALWAAGAVTIASCQNLTDAMQRLWPAQLAELQRRALPPQLNYQHTVRHALAFIRGVDSPAWAAVAAAVEALDQGQVMRWGPAIHITFPLDAVDRLTAAAQP